MNDQTSRNSTFRWSKFLLYLKPAVNRQPGFRRGDSLELDVLFLHLYVFKGIFIQMKYNNSQCLVKISNGACRAPQARLELSGLLWTFSIHYKRFKHNLDQKYELFQKSTFRLPDRYFDPPSFLTWFHLDSN